MSLVIDFLVMKNKYYVFLCIVVSLVGGCRRKSDKDMAGGTPSVNVAVVTTDSVVLHKDYPGTLKAAQRADVVGEVSGRLLSKNYTSGAYVHKGQVLFTIESTKYHDALTQAQASLTTAEGQRDFYSSQSAAMKKAYDEEAVSKMELLQSQTSLRSAEASIRNARAAIESAQTMLSKCTVRAPISGYITDSEMSVGNYVNGEGNPQVLATIYDNTQLNAVFSIEDDQYRKLLGGADANAKGTSTPLYSSMPLKFATPPAHTYTADLYYVAPTVSNTTGSLQLQGKVINIDNELRDGMYVTISLPYGTEPNAVIVKDAALSTDQLGKYLYVVNDSDKVVYTPVTTGPLFQDSLRVITKGVKPGQKYVTEALLTVRNGMKVKPVIK